MGEQVVVNTQSKRQIRCIPAHVGKRQHRNRVRTNLNVGTSVADVWGDGTLAFVAHIGQNVVNIVDVSNPDAASTA